ncbi:MAG: hypothetical protein ACOYJL_00070 [Tractidigestivibacter sp.]|jgi:glycine cleavage system aminomethyltransferase T|uniref:hypothetical protein n=1 Tax=Tractidigestivibacter sp. TaxID=2847320 RepID=UPI003D8EAF70
MSEGMDVVQFPHLSCVPIDPEETGYINWGELVPYVYTNWREETLSWKTSCYLGANLSCFPPVDVKGKDATRFCADFSVNKYKKFPVGSGKHLVTLTKEGDIMDHGLVLRTAEDTYQLWLMDFWPRYFASQRDYDIEFVNYNPAPYVFQIAGPRSLEVIENACHEDLHDLKFMRFRDAEIAGHRVRVLRMGMGGTLAYEVHGPREEGIDVYNAIFEIGKKYGMRKLGVNQYMCNHTENGFPQQTLHFPGATTEEPGFIQYMKDLSSDWYDEGWTGESIPKGSWSTDIHDYYRNPLEVGWGFMIDWDSNFYGKEALLKKKEAGVRKVVTLEWNVDDIMRSLHSYFEKGQEPYDDMPFPQDFGVMGAGENKYIQNTVLRNGKVVGVSMWRTYTLYYRRTISMACVDQDLNEGDEVEIVWGDTGHRQINIRATIARYPYLDLARNKDFDMESIPHYAG